MANAKREGEIKRTVKKRNKRRRRRLLAFFLLLFFCLLCVAAVLSVTILFPIKNIAVDGESVYSKEEIISASGVTLDDNFFLLSKNKITSAISEGLPKSGDIKVKKVFPDTVKITVNTAVPTYFLLIDDVYCVTDQYYKVIEQVTEPPENCIQIKVKDLKAVSPGKTVVFTQEDSDMLNSIFKLCNDKQIAISGVDISDAVKLKVVLNGRLLVQLGGAIDLEYKIAHLAAMLPKMEEGAQGTINLSVWTSSNTKASFRDEKINSFEFSTQK